ncbi:hypothetical protein RTP6_006177 [Batrachochytrium dendrobatidis]
MNQDTNTETAASQNEQDAASRMNDLQKQLLELGIDVSSTIGKVSRSNLIKQLKQAKSRLKATQEAAVKAERDARLVSTSYWTILTLTGPALLNSCSTRSDKYNQ